MKNENQARIKYLNLFDIRHEEMKDVWGLPDEIAEGAKNFLDELGDDRIWVTQNALLDYDNLAINAEYVDREEAQAQYGKTAEELEADALFCTENYIILNW